MIGKRVAQYRILEKLGQGGIGEVFLAEDTELHRNVALKFFPASSSQDDAALARFKHEARSSAALYHPNITTIYEVGVYEDRPYIAMAYVDGEKLTDVIDSGRLDLDRTLDIVGQICEGLSKAHKAGIIHRDIKPDNILLDRDGRVRILDFGVAKLRGKVELSGEISTVGTAFYMSPEQINRAEVDNRSDVFSLGVILYQMASGRRPFKGEHTAAVFYSITNEEAAPLETKSVKGARRDELERVIFKALEKDPENRYRGVDELGEDLERLRDAGYNRKPRARWRRAAVLAPAAVVAAVLILFVLRSSLEINRNGGAVAAENALAIMYFENLADPNDPQRLGEIVTNLMITDLSESRYLQVVSSQRLFDLLKLEGKEDVKVIDRTTATDIATRAGAEWMLQGSILQVEPNFVLTSQLVDVASGNVVGSQYISGNPDETIFEMVDRLSAEAKEDLSIPAMDRDTEDTDVADVTTHSVEAYRAYLIGVEKENKYFMNEARECFKKAVALDSTFAMALLHLSHNRVSGTYAEKSRALQRAVRYADRASKKEMIHIRSEAAAFKGDASTAIAGFETITELHPNEKQAYIRLGELYRDVKRDMDKARWAFEEVISIDPLDKSAYNQLAYLYNFTGDFERSIWAINQYINLAPDEPNPYDSRADLYAYNGDVDQAANSYTKALEKKTDFFPSMVKLGHMEVFRDNFDSAIEYYDKVSSEGDEDFSRWARTCAAYVPLYRGDFGSTLQGLNDEISRDRSDGYGGDAYIGKLFARAYLYANLGDVAQAREAAEEYRDEYRRLRPNDDEWWRLNYGFLMYHCDDTEMADEMLGAFVTSIDTMNEARMMGYATLKGLIEMNRGNADAACSYLERANRTIKIFSRQHWLGRAYLEAGRPEEAVEVFDDLLFRFSEDRAGEPVLSVTSWYHAGLAAERAGQLEKARRYYDRFLWFWGNAEPLPNEVGDAKSRLDSLSQNL